MIGLLRQNLPVNALRLRQAPGLMVLERNLNRLVNRGLAHGRYVPCRAFDAARVLFRRIQIEPDDSDIPIEIHLRVEIHPVKVIAIGQDQFIVLSEFEL